MNPCGHLVDVGRDYRHFGKVYPFKDRPDVAVFVLWYPVPLDTPVLPYASPFVLRNWDRLEQEPQTVLGTDQNYRWNYPVSYTPGVQDHVCGTEDEWANGVLYSKYLAGGYSCDCPALACQHSALIGSGGLAAGGTGYGARHLVGRGGVDLGGDGYLVHRLLGDGGVVLGGDAYE